MFLENYQKLWLWHMGIWRSSHQRCSVRKGVVGNFGKFTEQHLCQSLLFNKVAGLNLQLYWKRDPGTGIFRWILRNFLEHLFCKTPPGHCFCIWFSLHIYWVVTVIENKKKLLIQSRFKSQLFGLHVFFVFFRK